MKHLIILLLVVSSIFTQDEPDQDEIQIISDLYDIFKKDMEIEIEEKNVVVMVPKNFLSHNITGKLKGDSEFNFTINNKTFEHQKEFTFKFNDYFIDVENNLGFGMEFENLEQNNITLSIGRITLPYDYLLKKVDEEYCKDIKENIKQLMERAYIYLDYAKNPKQPEGFDNYFEKVDFIKDLEEIKTKDRTYYEFYRDIKEALGKFKDYHLNIVSESSPDGVDLSKSIAFIPFSFNIKKDTDTDNAKLYIEPQSLFLNKFFPEYKDQIEKLKKFPLKFINGNDPFNYIQNFIGNKFSQSKNPHATFSNNINGGVAGVFSLDFMPLTKEELSDVNFEFENGESFNISYQFFIFKSDSFTEEFNNFFHQELIKYQRKFIRPTIFEINQNFLIHKKLVTKDFFKKKNYLLKKRNLQEEGEEEEETEKGIDWDFEFIDVDETTKFKCRVDKDNEVNVLVQTDFMFQNPQEAFDTIVNCSEIFHSNEYPLIIIESRNGGGLAAFGLVFMEILQTAIYPTEFLSYKTDKIIFDDHFGHSYVDTCKKANPIKDKKTEIDDYEGVTHKRTPIYNFLDRETAKEINDIRNEFLSKYRNKKPTEIIVFTDGFSYSTTSLFIKGLQKEGGAIIVGYLGNPNLTDVSFDGSQSPSLVQDFGNTDYSKKLKNRGYHIHGITVAETFDNPHDKNQIPREYQLNPVDERVDIYEPYTDDIYEEFVNKGKDIFEYYKDNCNKNNERLTLFTDECKNIAKISHSHGGKRCGDNGTWSDECIPIYCDSGYYFDHDKNQCVKDACLFPEVKDDDDDDDDKKKYFIIGGAIIGLILIIIIIICIVKKSKGSGKESSQIENIEKGRLIDD